MGSDGAVASDEVPRVSGKVPSDEVTGDKVADGEENEEVPKPTNVVKLVSNCIHWSVLQLAS